MNLRRSVFATLAASLALATASHAATWSGSATCEVTVIGPNSYNDKQTHTWTINGATPMHTGAFDYYPASWEVTGRGSFERASGTQSLLGRWERNASVKSAPIVVLLRASDGATLINSGHAQLHPVHGVLGTQEVRDGGKTISTAKMDLEAFEIAFPASQGAANVTRISGQKTETPSGSFGPMQPAGSKITLKCNWDFQKGAQGSAAQSSSSAATATSAPASSAHPVITPAGGSTPVAPPSSGAAAIPSDSPNDSGASADCAAQRAAIAEQYTTMEQVLEQQYAEVKRDKLAEKASLQAQLDALRANRRSENNPVIKTQIRDIEARLAQIDAELQAVEKERADALAEIDREKSKAESQAASKQCGP